ncbi:MAG: response regulator [Flavobacteriales bacterium]|nr:response regulator [Flavobacteriales bacterium]MCB9447588.1 response regulator [Flavobacteriales bacterium]
MTQSEHAQTLQSLLPTSGNGLPKPKVLMVDDHMENLVALDRLLKDMNLDLYKATSGNEALKLTLRHDFALALLDIQMPEMDGYELAEILRSEEKTAQMPFIFISAIYTTNLNVFRGYELGAFSYITKPFDPQVLLNKVRIFIEKYEQQQLLMESQKWLEIKVKERTEALQRSNKDLEQFAYIASHDLQEPLRTVTSYLQMIQRNNAGKLDEKSERYIEIVVNGAKRMKALIDGLLSYSKLASNTDLEVEKVNCEETIRKVMTDLRVIISENGAKITTEGLPSIEANPLHMHLLFQNLLSNAIKFKHPERTPEIHIKAVKDDEHYIFSVQDNGIGIEQEFFERVFVIFQRLHTRQEYEGTGIGLSICKKIVERHKGRIWITSEPGKGTCIHFRIPIHHPKEDHHQKQWN